MTETLVSPMAGTHSQHVTSEVMSLALDDLLDTADRRQFDLHLQGCDLCRSQWTKWQHISNVMQMEPFVGPAPGFALRLNQRFYQQQQRRERMLGGIVLIGGTLAIWTLLVLGLLLSTSVWLTIQPEARVDTIQYLGFGGQLVALLINNLSTLRSAVLALAPSPATIVVVGFALAIAGLIWIKLVFYRSLPPNGYASHASPGSTNGFRTAQDRSRR